MSRPIEGIELGEAVEEDFDGVVGKHVLENAGIDVVEGDVAEFALMSQIDDQISAQPTTTPAHSGNASSIARAKPIGHTKLSSLN